MTLAHVSLGIAALAFAGFGAALLLFPDLMNIVGIELHGPSARGEIRAFYGGLELGLAVFFLLALRRAAWIRPALMTQVLTLAGVACGRIVGMLVDGSPELIVYVFFTVEASGALLGLVALRRCAPPESSARAETHSV